MHVTETVPPRDDLPALVDAGDRACALRDRTTLAAVAHALGDQLGAPLVIGLRDIERLAASDLDAATRRWSVMSRCFHDWFAASLVHRN